jgi:hypothetical protein
VKRSGHRSRRRLNAQARSRNRIETERLAEIVRNLESGPVGLQRQFAAQNILSALFRGADPTLLSPLLRSNDAEVVRIALGVMVEFEGRDCSALELVLTHLDDEDARTRHLCQEFILLCASAGHTVQTA